MFPPWRGSTRTARWQCIEVVGDFLRHAIPAPCELREMQPRDQAAGD